MCTVGPIYYGPPLYCGRNNPFKTAVPFWGQTTLIPSILSPKRDCSPEWVERLGSAAKDVSRVLKCFKSIGRSAFFFCLCRLRWCVKIRLSDGALDSMFRSARSIICSVRIVGVLWVQLVYDLYAVVVDTQFPELYIKGKHDIQKKKTKL